MIIESVIGGMLIMTPIDMGKDYNEHLQDVGQAKCLADNMYFEARNQGTAGITAVSNVVLNRVRSEMYPNTICEEFGLNIEDTYEWCENNHSASYGL